MAATIGKSTTSGVRAYTINDPLELLQWPASDRCILTLADADGPA